MGPLSGLSIVIPAFNEEASLAAVVEDCRAAAARLAHRSQIVVVDDGSADRTGAIADGLEGIEVVHHPQNRGFGAAFRSGIEAARLEFVSLVPADGQFHAADLEPLAALIDRCDIAVGYRTDRGDPPLRRINTMVLRFVMNLAFGLRLRDINWVKLYRRAVFETVRPEFGGIGIDAEILVRARAAGFRFREARVGYHPRTSGVATGGQWKNVRRTLRELRVLVSRPSGRRSGCRSSSAPPVC